MALSVTSLTEPKAVLIAGPTAAGKSALGLAVAEEFNGVIINADSQQRYRDLRILTSRPTAEEEARVPHRLFGDLGPAGMGSAAEWAEKAAAEIQNATAQGKVPILVGGTGLYFRALTQGLAEMPAVPAEIRASAKILRDEIGPDAFHGRLAERDPVAAARLNPGDSQRILRAWEVVEATGTPLSTWQLAESTPPLTARYFQVAVLPPREFIYAACDARFKNMVRDGGLAEVQGLMDRGIDLTQGIGKALGVADLASALRGEYPLEEAVTLAQTATRQYAKRQMTWFRNQFHADLTICKKYSESLLPEIFSDIRHFLLT
ncbi:MAG: tRNA (adenosine(37)-N6)-dimethylallyltransferase MiaA [Rhodospirillaceae bacterium]|nr:tRNA (adenosine(37)-N6)-dimethylallyltransferase MiaA [Rhodospirillaceae bacterium]